MKANAAFALWTAVLAPLAASSLCPPAIQAQTPLRQYRGLSLSDALRALQARGLRIVFTSNIVTPDMRVQIEPRGRTPRVQLDELLAPHNLQGEPGPGGVIQVTRARPPKERPRPVAANQEKAKGRRDRTTASVLGHREQITVTPSWPYKTDRGVAAETRVDRSALDAVQGDRLDHPMRIIHSLPGVSAVDDFRSEFAVRGSPFRHAEVVVDGVSTPWLQHAVHGREATSSLAMLTGYTIESATLRVGAYPRRYSDRLGAQLDLALREGERSQFTLRGALGGTNATIVGEGPIGRSTRGSWLVAVRHSYLEWPPGRAESTRSAFGFSDGLARLVYDVRQDQRLSMTAIAGSSSVDGEDNVAGTELNDGTNRAGVLNFAWRSTFGSSLLFTQRVYLVRHRYDDTRHGARGSNEDVVYRAEVAHAIGTSVVEAAGQLGRTESSRDGPAYGAFPEDSAGSRAGNRFETSSGHRSAYVHVAWRVVPSLTLSPGLRVTDSALVRRPAVTRWLLGEWVLGDGWTLNSSAGISYQLPEMQQARSAEGSGQLAPERAAHLDLGVERRISGSTRWQASVFRRTERDILRDPDENARLIGGVLATQTSHGFTNVLRGAFTGVELLAERRSASGLSGWASYSFGKSVYTDADGRETFPADFDQRHAVNLFGVYTFPNRHSRVSATLHAGSNFPIRGYLTSRGGGLIAGSQRNQVRLPAYARLDLQAQHGFDYLDRRMTLFVEVLNVLDRHNLGRAAGSIDPLTGAATGFTNPLFRRRASGGIMVEF